MYYFSKRSRSKIYHVQSCRYVNLISSDNMASCHNRDELMEMGYTYCDHCSPAGKYYRENKKFFEENPEILNTYSIKLTDGEIEITSPRSEYLIIFGKKKRMYLYHKNAIEVYDAVTRIEGYHLQRKGRYSLAETMQYIIEHDDYRKTHPLSYSAQLSEKIRDDSLFQNIPKKYFEASDEKSERMKRVESYHEKGHQQNPQKSGARGHKYYKKKKRKQRRSNNAANVRRVNSLLSKLEQKA